jgi:hypothetical protein
MAVVINEFDVVPAEAKQPTAAAPGPGAETQSPPSEHEIQRLVENQISREERIWAH